MTTTSETRVNRNKTRATKRAIQFDNTYTNTVGPTAKELKAGAVFQTEPDYYNFYRVSEVKAFKDKKFLTVEALSYNDKTDDFYSPLLGDRGGNVRSLTDKNLKVYTTLLGNVVYASFNMENIIVIQRHDGKPTYTPIEL